MSLKWLESIMLSICSQVIPFANCPVLEKKFGRLSTRCFKEGVEVIDRETRTG